MPRSSAAGLISRLARSCAARMFDQSDVVSRFGAASRAAWGAAPPKANADVSTERTMAQREARERERRCFRGLGMADLHARCACLRGKQRPRELDGRAR